MALLEVDGLSYMYPGSIDFALRDISLYVEKGEFVSVIGPNGSGKSTLALILSGLVEEKEGSIHPIRGERRKLSRIVFQNPDNQIVGETVEEDVAFGPENMNLESGVIRTLVDNALSSVGLYDKRYLSPDALSGGEKQRLAVASALALEPEVLILDEASSMLDNTSSERILSILKRKCIEDGLSVIYITHHTHETVFSDRIYVMNCGRIVKSGTPRETLTYDILSSNNLPVPYPVLVSHKLGLGETLTLDELNSAVMRRLESV